MANGLRLDPRGLGETVGTSGGKFFFTPPNHSSPKGLMICGCKKSSLKKKLHITSTVLISCHVEDPPWN